MSISAVVAQQRLDSRGNPTVQVLLHCNGHEYRAIVPSGASKGDYEAVELRDEDPAMYHGKSVLKAVHNINTILGPAICLSGLSPGDSLKKLDRMMIDMDGKPDKSRLGANSILGISMAAARAGAFALRIPLYEFLARESGILNQDFILPVPFMNILNGGDHSGNPMAFQEFMIAPTHASSFAEAVQWNVEVYQNLKELLSQKYGKSAIGLGDEGGFAPPIENPRQALDLILESIKSTGHEGKIQIGVDFAAQSFFRDGNYDLRFKGNEANLVTPSELAKLCRELLAEYPIILLEDPFGQDDWSSFASLASTIDVELVGDDLLATNKERIGRGIEKKACNSLLLKINQIGTITEAIDAATQAYRAGWSVFVSHRSGETTDDFIADLAVGLRTGHLKAGAPARGERVAKYNRLLDIEDELAKRGIPHRYAGTDFRSARDI